MKITGIVLVVFGLLSGLIAIIETANGYRTSFAGLTIVALGAFLITKAEKKKKLEQGSSEKNN